MRKFLAARNKFILAVLLALAASAAHAGEPLQVKPAVDRTKITIGDKVNYTLEVSYPAKMTVILPDPAKSMNAFEIKDFKVKGPSKSWGKMKLSCSYLLTTFLTGEYTIEPMVFAYTEQDGTKKELKTEPVKITVESVKPGKTDFGDIKDVKPPLKVKTKFWLYFFLSIIVIALACAGWWFYSQKRSRKGIFSDAEPARPADEVALERLAKLKAMELVAQGRIKEHYIILSEIIRKYIESRFNIPVLDRTTAELYREMRQAEMSKQHIRLIKDFLDECDLVKFARYSPDADLIEKDFSAAGEIVEQTRLPKPDPAAGAKQ
jgi:hypothetical protein